MLLLAIKLGDQWLRDMMSISPQQPTAHLVEGHPTLLVPTRHSENNLCQATQH